MKKIISFTFLFILFNSNSWSSQEKKKIGDFGELLNVISKKETKAKVINALRDNTNGVLEINKDESLSDCKDQVPNFKLPVITCTNPKALHLEGVRLAPNQVWGRSGSKETQELIQTKYQFFNIEETAKQHFKIIEENGSLVIENLSLYGVRIYENGRTTPFVLNNTSQNKFPLNPGRPFEIHFGGYKLVCKGEDSRATVKEVLRPDRMVQPLPNDECKDVFHNANLAIRWNKNNCVLDSVMMALLSGEHNKLIWSIFDENKLKSPKFKKTLKDLKEFLCGDLTKSKSITDFRSSFEDELKARKVPDYEKYKSAYTPKGETFIPLFYEMLGEVFPEFKNTVSLPSDGFEGINRRLEREFVKGQFRPGFNQNLMVLRMDYRDDKEAPIDFKSEITLDGKTKTFVLQSITYFCSLAHVCSLLYDSKSGKIYKFDGIKEKSRRVEEFGNVNDPNIHKKINETVGKFNPGTAHFVYTSQ